ncbi:MAG: zinc ribbon domain protein [Podoviridae sp. ctviO18]|nr:MAG: zinc ribbon domain protein [Podoviridae sp. ctviO18]
MKTVQLKCIECQSKFRCPASEADHVIFCYTCQENKCDNCGIVLSNKYQCRCEKFHGRYEVGTNKCNNCLTLINLPIPYREGINKSHLWEPEPSLAGEGSA